MSTPTTAPKPTTKPTASTKPTSPKAAPKKSEPQTKKPANNLFIGVGCLGRDPELRYAGDGRAWCKTSLAIFQGEDKDPIWLDLKAFAKPLDAGGWDESVPLALAELKKGQRISVRGKLYCDKREYNGKDYVDWGLVLYAAPTIVESDKKDSPDDGADHEPD